MLNVKNLTVKRSGRDVLNDITFKASNGNWLMLAGPNGAGKTTLIGAISQSLPYLGEIEIAGKNAAFVPRKKIAGFIGVLEQTNYVNYPFSVYEIVSLGRYSYQTGFFKVLNAEDMEKIDTALNAVGMYHLKERSILTLSGGELRRAFLAQVIAQDPQIIILDEPANNLDLQYQKQIFELISKWIEDTGRLCITAVHDLNLARAFGTHALLLQGGKLFGYGKAHEILTGNNLADVYSMDVNAWFEFLNDAWRK
ncbi:MAG: ABC transporter ATP-binding protein [Clostridiales bacterium]|nr:ABC transporter ATP-binding protein [Clostridiales bacterium]